jgi:hypothetical protein
LVKKTRQHCLPQKIDGVVLYVDPNAKSMFSQFPTASSIYLHPTMNQLNPYPKYKAPLCSLCLLPIHTHSAATCRSYPTPAAPSLAACRRSSAYASSSSTHSLAAAASPPPLGLSLALLHPPFFPTPETLGAAARRFWTSPSGHPARAAAVAPAPHPHG